ncbi:Sec-independent protein translocase protein TatB [Ensifer adhaerens]|uniref:Sec-independent protein translocase protein TatB n=1 Tax=Ensifer adhaerens TaxID=106592 RepID=UPI003D0109DD
MLDIGWTELVVIAIVLIVVVGPKDLPPMLRAFGRMTAKLRGMASDFRQQFDEALREADLDEVRKTISDAQSLNPANALRDAINPLRQMGNEIKADLQKAATPDRPEATNSVDPVTAVEPVAAPAAPAVVEAKPADAVAAAAIGSANRQIERAETAAVPAEKPKRAPKAKVDTAPAATKAASKTAAAAPRSTAKSSAKAPAKPVAEKSKVTPAAAEPAAKTSKPRTTARKKGEA